MSAKANWRKWLMAPIAHQFTSMPGRSTPCSGTVSSAQMQIAANCRKHVNMLAGEIGERHIQKYEQLEQARQYITHIWQELGYEPVQDTFMLKRKQVANVVAEKAGQTSRQPTLVLGAHYDTVFGSPGANDNASGVAALLEIARLLKGTALKCGLIFVAFTNEEHQNLPPEKMGSYVFARRLRRKGKRLLGMWSLETIGFYTSEPGSQNYPYPFNMFYPETGDFLAFVGSFEDRNFIHKSIKAFRAQNAFPSQGVAAPASYPDIWRSDHWGFRQFGYPALMLTDTANFRYTHYHLPSDTQEKLDYEGMARIVEALTKAICIVAGTV